MPAEHHADSVTPPSTTSWDSSCVLRTALTCSPALGGGSEFAVRGAAAVAVDVQQAGVALLALLHPGVPADVAVALP